MLFTVTFTSKETGLSEFGGTFETLRKATSYAKRLSTRFSGVVVWNGQPGGERAYECDAARFGDRCNYCAA